MPAFCASHRGAVSGRAFPSSPTAAPTRPPAAQCLRPAALCRPPAALCRPPAGSISPAGLIAPRRLALDLIHLRRRLPTHGRGFGLP